LGDPSCQFVGYRDQHLRRVDRQDPIRVGVRQFVDYRDQHLRTVDQQDPLSKQTSVAATTTCSQLIVIVVVDFSRVDDQLDYDYSTNYDYDYRKCHSR